jgi:hypothetical protein
MLHGEENLADLQSENQGSFPGTHWIVLRENLQETMVFTIKYRAFL